MIGIVFDTHLLTFLHGFALDMDYIVGLYQARVQEFVRGGAQNLKAFFFFFFFAFQFFRGGAQLRN